MTIKEKVHRRICEHLYNTSNSVSAKNVQGLFNLRCHENSVQYALKNKDVHVVMGIIVDSNFPSLHFWNKKGNRILETTLGYQCNQYDYYEQRIITKNEWNNVRGIFNEGLDYWWQTYVKWWERPFIKGGRIV